MHRVVFEGSEPKLLRKFCTSKRCSFLIAINVEIDLIIFNNNWVLMDLPLVLKPIGWEWGIRTIYKIFWPKVS